MTVMPMVRTRKKVPMNSTAYLPIGISLLARNGRRLPHSPVQDLVQSADCASDRLLRPGVCMTVRQRAVGCLVLLCAAMSGAVDAQAPLSPREALGLLKAGNNRFARNASSPVSISVNRRRELALAQHPIAMVLSCADSRVPPEYIFNAGLGDLFVIRTAGEVVDRSILATIEYGADHLSIPLLVVMGHESCGAVSAAAAASAQGASAPKESTAPAQSPNLEYLLKAIQAAK